MIDTRTKEKIEKRVRELTHGLEVGKTYTIRGSDGELLERKVIEIGKTYLIYLRQGRPTKCQIDTFRRIVEEHGVDSR